MSSQELSQQPHDTNLPKPFSGACRDAFLLALGISCLVWWGLSSLVF